MKLSAGIPWHSKEVGIAEDPLTPPQNAVNRKTSKKPEFKFQTVVHMLPSRCDTCPLETVEIGL